MIGKLDSIKREKVLILNAGTIDKYLAIVITSLIFSSILFYILLFFHKYALNNYVKISTVFFFIICVLSSDIINLEYSLFVNKKMKYKPPFQFILIYFLLIIICFINLPDELKLSINYSILKYNIEFIIPFSFVSLAVIDPIFKSIRNVFFKVLEIISGLDYQLILDGSTFRYNLELKFSEKKRYGGSLSLMVFTSKINNTKGYKKLSHKHHMKLNLHVINIMRNSMRITDVFGNFEKGNIGSILSNTDIKGAYIAAERIMDILENDKTLKKEFNKYDIRLKCGISRYSSTMESCDVLINNALDCLQEALNDNEKNIVYKD